MSMICLNVFIICLASVVSFFRVSSSCLIGSANHAAIKGTVAFYSSGLIDTPDRFSVFRFFVLVSFWIGSAAMILFSLFDVFFHSSDLTVFRYLRFVFVIGLEKY